MCRLAFQRNFTHAIVQRLADRLTTLFERERSHFACDTVIYVGDDETDEDVFQLNRPGQLLSIRVGRKRGSTAPYYLRNQAEIDRLLETLVAVRGDFHGDQ